MQVTVTKNKKWIALDNDGKDWADKIPNYRMKEAMENDSYLISKTGHTGKVFWRLGDKIKHEKVEESPMNDNAKFISKLSNVDKLKPENLFMSELHWKYLCRTAFRGKNILITGPSGSGKTLAAQSLVKALKRPFFYFNLGATQDPRNSLIGNTHFDKDVGTYFSEALFVKAIQTEGAIILLDELSRAHPEAWNILMTVLDERQRYLRLDEDSEHGEIQVAKDVCFVATANIGNEYTSTRVMDAALVDRFTRVEMAVLEEEEELALLNLLYPDLSDYDKTSIAKIVHSTRLDAASEQGNLSYAISTRNSVEMAGLIYDGFSLEEAAEVCLYNRYDSSGGVESERTFIKQLVQKFISPDTEEELFSGGDIKTAETF